MHAADDTTTDPGRRRRSAQASRAAVLVSIGCALFVVALGAPVMQWSANAVHESAGNARIWLGDGWTLADGGFGGAFLLPIASVAVVPLVLLSMFGRSQSVWRVQLVLAGVVGYVHAWTAVAFLRKWEDEVGFDVGAVALVLSAVAIAGGLWTGRPQRSSRAGNVDT